MTSTAWNNVPFYGRKLKRDFAHLDTLTKKIFAQDEISLDAIETVLKMLHHKRNIALTVTKMIEISDTTQRLENIERIIENVSPEVLAEAKSKLGI